MDFQGESNERLVNAYKELLKKYDSLKAAYDIEIAERKQTEFLLKEQKDEIEAQNEEYQQINEELIQINEELQIAKAKAEENERKIKEQSQEIESFFTCAVDLLCIANVGGYFIRLNKEWENTLGYSLRDLEGRQFLEFIHPEDISSTLQAMAQLDKQIAVNGFTNRYRCKDGSYKWIEWKSYPSGDKIFAAARDITPHKILEAELRAAKEKAEKSEASLLKQNEMVSILLDNLTQGVFMVEAPSGKPILANKAAKEILGRGILPDASMDNLGEVYKAFKAGTLTPYPPEEMPIIQGMMGNTRYVDDMVIEQPDGILVNVEIYGTPVTDQSGKVWASLVSFSDITERIKSKNELIKAKEKAEENDRLKTAFLQNMSHEIRTPMNAIMGFSDLLFENANDHEKLKQFTEIINQRCNDLLDIINDILDIAKIESGQLSVNKEQCDLVDLFAELTAFFNEYQKRVNKQHIKFSIKAPCNLSESKIITDKVKLKQIFINLITNAFKFTNEGWIEGGCKFDDEQNIVFYVSDTGLGIPADKQQFVFERFTQLQHSNKLNMGGTGLGLPIVKALTGLLGGEISLESEPGKGSTFSIKFPFISDRSLLPHRVTSENLNGEKFNGKTILIVEDDSYNALYIQTALSGKGFNVMLAENGRQAIDFSVSHPVDLVLMDIRLPDINGYEATQQIRRHKPQLKIIAQTAYASLDEKQRALEAGCIDYISKPTKQAALLKMLNKHLLL